MRILVTGVRSFTAKHLLPLLEGRGDVFGTDLDGPRIDDVRFLPADITDAGRVVEVIGEARPDLILHLAGVSGATPDQCMAVNLEGTRNVFRALTAMATAPRVLLVSSAAVYGRIRLEETPVKESTPTRPAGPYGESKAKAEQVARDAHSQGLARVMIVRPFNLIGPGLSLGLAPSDFLAEIKRVQRGDGEPVIRVGNLEPRRDFVDVRDAVRAYVLLAENPDAYGQVFNVGSGRPTAIKDLLERMIALSGVNVRVETDPSRLRDVDVPEMVAEIGAIKSVVGWVPKIALDQSLEAMIEKT